jgi:hypothetical protein
LNLYGFVYNNPIWAIDDSGLSVITIGGSISATSNPPTIPFIGESTWINIPEPFGYYDFPQPPFAHPVEEQPPPVDYSQPKDYNCAGLASRTYEYIKTAEAARSIGDQLGYGIGCNDYCKAPFFRYVVIEFERRIRQTFSGTAFDSPVLDEIDWHAYSGTGNQPNNYGLGGDIFILNNDNIGAGTQFPIDKKDFVIIHRVVSKNCYCICCPKSGMNSK